MQFRIPEAKAAQLGKMDLTYIPTKTVSREQLKTQKQKI